MSEDVVRHVDKPWGFEDYLEENEDFVIKRIKLNEGQRSSLQLHERKREWVRVESGALQLEIGPSADALEVLTLRAGEVYRVPPGTVHRVLATEDVVILEVATPGDDDIVRLEDDYGR